MIFSLFLFGTFRTVIKEAEVEDLRGKFDRSLLRKQKENALRMLEEEKTKVLKLEQMLANKENEVGQLESVLAQSKYTSFSTPSLEQSNKIFSR